jgi:hypothetical protein
MNKFTFLKAFDSPFKRPKLNLYIGKVAIGTPYFFPRKTVKSKTKEGYLEFVPKKIGFDFVGLGYKLKWNDTDYRFEWSPVWSFVFFKWQIAITFNAPQEYHYWEAWLYYQKNTDTTKSKLERIQQCMNEFSLLYTVSTNGNKETIDYYTKVLKSEYLKQQL